MVYTGTLDEIREELAEALERGEFHVWYQPQVEMETGRIAGAEALVRWHSPVHGLLLPGQFIPALEDRGLMPLLDGEVLRIVCIDMQEAEKRGVCLGPVSVNLTRLHAGLTVRAGGVEDACAAMGLRTDRLLFELTETADPEGSERQMRDFAGRLRAKGFRIAMDDYGMGTSTLKTLHQIAFDILKLDRYFVSRIGEEKAEKILSSTIAMANGLGMEVVAEGVERREQTAFLLEHGCRMAQGYYYAPPLTKERYIRYRAEGKRAAGQGEKRMRRLYRRLAFVYLASALLFVLLFAVSLYIRGREEKGYYLYQLLGGVDGNLDEAQEAYDDAVRRLCDTYATHAREAAYILAREGEVEVPALETLRELLDVGAVSLLDDGGRIILSTKESLHGDKGGGLCHGADPGGTGKKRGGRPGGRAGFLGAAGVPLRGRAGRVCAVCRCPDRRGYVPPGADKRRAACPGDAWAGHDGVWHEYFRRREGPGPDHRDHGEQPAGHRDRAG